MVNGFTYRQLFIEANREHKLSVRVYGRLLIQGKMTQENHDRGLAMKAAIRDHFAELADAEDTLPFFGKEEESA